MHALLLWGEERKAVKCLCWRGGEALWQVEWCLVVFLKLGKELSLPWLINGTLLRQWFNFSKSFNNG